MMKKNHNLHILPFGLALLISQPVLARELLDQEKEIIANVVKDELLDSESAKFRWVPLPKYGIEVYCGLVNSKNSFGGYAGWAPYVVSPVWFKQTMKGASVIGVGTSNDDSPATIAVMATCAKHGYTELFLAK
ncbi:MAG: hypothetical protein NUV55_11620 [Sulfuricaulis sp.]|uniref:hypothetical protein n=1 Tax=Sulfuricaulis sp. TaxID=2003553 RepID=UPI0025F8A963|nr:hypothetical protein [Sulfuricaulis sp.]MCR4347833.1 hypothetical protein [Sulfuricaulis sp.]